MVTITALNIYPVKSCKGIALEHAPIADTGFARDREWLVTRPNGQFITQREEPRLALIATELTGDALVLSAPAVGTLTIPYALAGASVEVTCWRDKCLAFDAGAEAAAWLEAYLGGPHRLVRFDPSRTRLASALWTKDVESPTQFADGYPFLVISQASLDDLNGKLGRTLPMNRFRPNIVVDGLPAFGEDDVYEFSGDGVRLRVVKPCARCVITTTNQATAQREGDEPLRTLRSYRFNRELKGVMFGQNAILMEGAGRTLRVGQRLEATSKG